MLLIATLSSREADHMTALSPTVRRLRRSRGLTQDGCAQVLGISRSYYSQLESGARRWSLDLAGKMADVLQISLEEFFDIVNVAASNSDSRNENNIVGTGTNG